MRVVFIGTGDIGIPTLEWLLCSAHRVVAVVTQPDKPVGRHQELQPSAIKSRALAAGVEVLQPLKIRAQEAVDVLRALDAEVFVVMAYGQILSRTVLDLPKVACLNLHASLLPRHRGAAPIQAAIDSGDWESGVAVMYMAEGLDTGDVLLERRVPIRRRETGGSLHDRLALLAPGALEEALELLERAAAPRIPQEEEFATYAGKLSREHGEIRWGDPGSVDRRVRAMNPWPGAYTWLPLEGGRRKLKIFSVIQSHVESRGVPAGTVLRVERRGILVAAGARSVWLSQVQLEGKRRMAAAEFVRGMPLKPGMVLG
ncbi:MAG: 10-formyltetrahydrofolate:L-methionyl-tRNA(fMet) N-formyltransferase [Verrucomicrobiota bacterium]|jgi:methionyl-tRNA formyltransferase